MSLAPAVDISPTLEIAAQGFEGMVRELSKLSGKSFEFVLVHQAAAVLRNCVQHTAAASRASIEKRASKSFNHVEFDDGRIISWWKKADALMFLDVRVFKAPKKGGYQPPPPKTFKNGMVWHNTAHHMPPSIWANYQAHEALQQTKGFRRGLRKKRAAVLRQAMAARGVAKQSWLQIAADLGISPAEMGAPGYAAGAVPSNGHTYKNGTAKKFFEAAAAYIDLSNNNPLITHFYRPSGEQIMAASIQARLKAFDIDVANNVFDTTRSKAMRYPGIFTQS